MSNKYQKQLKRICKHFNIKVYYIIEKKKGYENYPLWASSEAVTAGGAICIAKPVGPEASYNFASALHEIGHCLEYHGKSPILKLKYEDQYFWASKRDIITNFRLESEHTAWKIAQLIGGKLWDHHCTAIRATAMSHYIRQFNDEHKKKINNPANILPYFTEIHPAELLDPSFTP